jgi:multidrug efflux system membrane fusion protein
MQDQPSSTRSRLRVAAGTALVLTAALVAAGGALTWQGQDANAGAAETPVTASAAPAPMPVSTALVVQREVNTWNDFSGRLEAVDRVVIRSRVAGTIQQAHFREGDLVRKGDLLMTIDPAPFAAEVDRAEAQVASAQARLAHTSGELTRAQRLWEERAVSRREVDDAVRARLEAAAQLRAAQAALQVARLDLGYTQVRAPVAGRVGKLETTVGNLTSGGPDAPVLTTLVSVDPVYATFEADESIVSRALASLQQAGGNRSDLSPIPVRMGTAAGEGTPYEGHLQLIDNQVDPGSGTVRLRAVFRNADGSLMPGQFARLRMGNPTLATELLVNERAVGTDQDRKFVLVVGDDNTVAYREVRLGAAIDGLRVVTSGLQPGERIVVNGLHRVRPGAWVAPETVAMDNKPELRRTATAAVRGASPSAGDGMKAEADSRAAAAS